MEMLLDGEILREGWLDADDIVGTVFVADILQGAVEFWVDIIEAVFMLRLVADWDEEKGNVFTKAGWERSISAKHMKHNRHSLINNEYNTTVKKDVFHTYGGKELPHESYLEYW